MTPMSKCLVTLGRKNFPLTGRNLQQNQGSAATVWGERRKIHTISGTLVTFEQSQASCCMWRWPNWQLAVAPYQHEWYEFSQTSIEQAYFPKSCFPLTRFARSQCQMNVSCRTTQCRVLTITGSLFFWEIACSAVTVRGRRQNSRAYYLDPGTASGCWWGCTSDRKQTWGGKVAEDGTQSKGESSSSFCLPKVYPVVYTPRRAAAPRAEGATLRSKMNMWHIWLFLERGDESRGLAVGRITGVPV